MARSPLASQLVAQCGISLLAALLVCLPAARAVISCYQCNSYEEPDCDKVIQGNATYDRFLKPCDGDYGGKQPFCRKMVQTLLRDEPVVRLRRACGWELSRGDCYHYEDELRSEVVCQCFEDGCNAAAKPTAAAAVALALAALLCVAFLRPH